MQTNCTGSCDMDQNDHSVTKSLTGGPSKDWGEHKSDDTDIRDEDGRQQVLAANDALPDTENNESDDTRRRDEDDRQQVLGGNDVLPDTENKKSDDTGRGDEDDRQQVLAGNNVLPDIENKKSDGTGRRDEDDRQQALADSDVLPVSEFIGSANAVGDDDDNAGVELLNVFEETGDIRGGQKVNSQEKPGHPVDTGYAWVVMIAAFCLQFLLIGYIKTLGVFFVEFQNKFGSNSSVTSVIIGVMELVCGLGSYIVMAGILKVISPRTACMIGSLFLTVGVAGNAWFSRVEWLILTQGVFFGAAIAFLFGPPLVCLTQYFEKKRALATSISTCGASIGGIVFPTLCRFLLDKYAFEGGVVLTAGFMAQAFVFSALLTPVTVYRTENTVFVKKKVRDKKPWSNLLARKSRTKALFLCSMGHDGQDDLDVQVKLPEQITDNVDSESNRRIRSSGDDKQRSRGSLCRRSNLLHSASFWVMALFFLCASIATVLPQTYVPPLTVERGLTYEDGDFFLSVMSILDIPAHLLPGLILTFRLAGPIVVCIVPLVIVGLLGFLNSLFLDYWSLLTMSIVYGLFSGSYFVMQPLVVIEFLGKENFSTAMGIYMIFVGMGSAVSYPIAGVLRDVTGTYTSSFAYLGSTAVLAAILLAFVPLAKRYDIRKRVLQ